MRVLFLGSKHQGLQALRAVHAAVEEALVGFVTLDDRDDARSVLDQFLDMTRASGITGAVATSRSDSEARISEFRPDLVVVVGWYWLLSSEILGLPRLGFVGVHNSLLPRYRGSSPLVWALIRGDEQIGCSLFGLAHRMDAGPVWAQRSLPVGPDDYVQDILARLEVVTVEMLSSTLPGILDGRVVPSIQDEARATYCAPRTAEDGEIDWQRSDKDVYRFIRAQSSPYPGAFTMVGSEKLTIWRARPAPESFLGTPGQIVSHPDGWTGIACGDATALILESIDLDGEALDPRHIRRRARLVGRQFARPAAASER
jgi:methionyl-tRNA formyltransferase